MVAIALCAAIAGPGACRAGPAAEALPISSAVGRPIGTVAGRERRILPGFRCARRARLRRCSEASPEPAANRTGDRAAAAARARRAPDSGRGPRIVHARRSPGAGAARRNAARDPRRQNPELLARHCASRPHLARAVRRRLVASGIPADAGQRHRESRAPGTRNLRIPRRQDQRVSRCNSSSKVRPTCSAGTSSRGAARISN